MLSSAAVMEKGREREEEERGGRGLDGRIHRSTEHRNNQEDQERSLRMGITTRWADRSIRERGGEARNIGRDPLASCFSLELHGVNDSLAIRVATVPVPVSVPFSVQSKICKIDSINIELGLLKN